MTGEDGSVTQPGGHGSTTNGSTDDGHGDLEAGTASPPTKVEEKRDSYINWDGPDDPDHPQNWSFWWKVYATLALAIMNLVTTIASSIFGSGSALLVKEFNVTKEVTVLGTTLFLLGFTLGPLVWGPLSEKIGRKIPMLAGVGVASIFSIMVAMGQNYATLMLGRFFSGCFGVAPIAVLGAVTDNWSAVDRGVALSAAIGMVFSGPIIGPIVGDFICASYLGWRWTMWVVVIFGLSMTVLFLFTLPETYPPQRLMKKSAQLRKETGDLNIRCRFDDESMALDYIARIYLIRPWRLFFTEPILVLVTIYQSFIYGLLYLFFEAYPIAFQEDRQWALGPSGLPYLGIIIGVACGCITVVIYTKTRFARQTRANGGEVIPEQRLPLMILGGSLLPIGLFWFAWTSNPDISWPSMVAAGIPIGWGMYTVFIQCFNYIIDVYTSIANSALAANAVVRSFFGAGFPLFASAMYHNLGVPWASSVLAFISLALVPVPVVFYIYGKRIRAMSSFTNKVE